MHYHKIVAGEFIKRPNRFIAWVKIGEEEVMVHVKNTGRCKELLVPGVKVFLEPSDNPTRKTKYSLISVYKGNRLINMDSQVPNQVVYEALAEDRIEGLTGIETLRREVKYNKSRFDIFYKKADREGFIEVKGVTLEEEGIALFPDAPTERGSKHIYELIEAKKEGYEAAIFFLIQMGAIHLFKPHIRRDPAFAEALVKAELAGVRILGYNSVVTEEKIELGQSIQVDVEGGI